MKKYKVSVIIASYNHSKTICRAIDSVIEQNVNLPVQILVIDDGSEDKTIEKVRERYENISDLFFVFSEHKNLMNTYNLGFKHSKGEYIAFCDGDDYWIDNKKLKKQVEYMDQNPNYGLCFTKVMIENNGIFSGMEVTTNRINEINFDSLLKGNAYIHAQSILIRKYDFDKYIDFAWFIRLGFHVWDYPIVLELIKHTKFYCLDFYSAVFVKGIETVTQTKFRRKRFKYILGNYWIRLYFICKFGCKFNTFMYLSYRFLRDIISIILKRWK